MTHYDGGPAFPVTEQRISASGESIFKGGSNGMTLRDWFAGQALAGLIHADGAQYFARFIEHAAMAYAQADAMIAERNKP